MRTARYSHLYKIDEAVQPGVRVRMGQPLGLLGKEGASGGWSHLHFGMSARQPSGLWGAVNGYPFIWEAYQHQYQPDSAIREFIREISTFRSK